MTGKRWRAIRTPTLPLGCAALRWSWTASQETTGCGSLNRWTIPRVCWKRSNVGVFLLLADAENGHCDGHRQKHKPVCGHRPGMTRLEDLTAKTYIFKLPYLFVCRLPQIEGAFMQGLGLYTLEELKYSPTGILYSRGPSQYKIPAVCDVPLKFNVFLLPDSCNPHAIYSSKVSTECWSDSRPILDLSWLFLAPQGIGEPTLFLGSSVFFAIKDALAAARSDSGLSGPFFLDTPATPERACLACASPFIKKVELRTVN